MVIWVSVWKTACPLVAVLIVVPPVSSARVVMMGKLVAKGPVSSLSDAVVGGLAAQGPVAREIIVMSWCAVLMKLWLLLMLWG